MQNVNKIKIENNQSIWDIALQEYGNVECVWQLVGDNRDVIANLDVKLVPGTELNIQIDKSIVSGYNAEVAKQLKIIDSKPANEFKEPELPLQGIVGWYKSWEVNSLTEEDGKNTIDNSEGITTFSRLYDFSGNGNHLVQASKENQPALVPFEGKIWADMFGDVHKLMEVAVSFPIPIYIAAIIRIEPDYGEVRNGYLIRVSESSAVPQGVQVTNQSISISMNTLLAPCGYTAMTASDLTNKKLFVLGKMNTDIDSSLQVNGTDHSYNANTSCNWHDGLFIKIGSSDDDYIPDAQILELAVFSGEPNLELLNNYFNWRR